MSEARRVLADAENIDGYLFLCNDSPINRAAREGNAYQPFFLSADDAQRFRRLVMRIPLLNDTNVLVLHSSAENGYPHTRPGVVCIPENFITSSSDTDLTETLCHEAIHMHQRRFPELWREKCAREGWTPIRTEAVPLCFREQCRLNPDTFYTIPFWAWEGVHVPLPMFKPSPQSLGDVRIEWLDLRTNALFHQPPSSFTARYGNPSQPEHPYELLAVEYAKAGVTHPIQLRGLLLQ